MIAEQERRKIIKEHYHETYEASITKEKWHYFFEMFHEGNDFLIAQHAAYKLLHLE